MKFVSLLRFVWRRQFNGQHRLLVASFAIGDGAPFILAAFDCCSCFGGGGEVLHHTGARSVSGHEIICG
eukprot:scaffold4463_cov51-Attheya_sp.AAC.11